jgi:DNA-binding transcriptional LysR family regulator
LEVEPYLTGEIELIVPTNHPWAFREEIEVSELVETQFLLREPGSRTYEILYAKSTQVGIAIESLDVLLTLGNSKAIVLTVKEGLGAAFISRLVVEKLGQESVATVRVAGLNLEREIFFARHDQRPATAAQKAFWEYVLHRHQESPPPVKTYAD